MGLEQFERRLERLVEGTFAKAFKGQLQPVEVGRRLKREMDLNRTIGSRGLISPNYFLVDLSPVDFDRFQQFEEAFKKELVAEIRDNALKEGYHFVGPIQVELQEDESLKPGIFLVTTETRQSGEFNQSFVVVLPDGKQVPIEDKPLCIGRLPTCDIVLTDPNISRQHAQLTREGDGVILTDLRSTNGTIVNGVMISEKRLSSGDEFTIGTTTLRLEIF